MLTKTYGRPVNEADIQWIKEVLSDLRFMRDEVSPHTLPNQSRGTAETSLFYAFDTALDELEELKTFMGKFTDAD